MLAGYGSTSTILAYIFYMLAIKPEEQERLRNEIDERFPLYLKNIDVKRQKN